MNKCVICGKECKSECCSGACRARKSRRTRTDTGARPERTVEAHALRHDKDKLRGLAEDIRDMNSPDRPITATEILRRRALEGATADTVVPSVTLADKPGKYGQVDCDCQHCKSNRATGSRHVLNHGAYKHADQLDGNELNRVTLPGDVDYVGVCKQVDGIWTA